ncbi:MAG: ATP phosphoribosyltransferase regulatory subunit [Erysipelotrichaceae bacterium]|nr:ATP phosphoribosyltransferase regulatory subunit [Erysipelotrichaceae bacterium]
MEEVKYLIPEESIDAIMSNVSSLREIENDLRHVFVDHGYLEVLMPSFEYADLYSDMDIGIEEEKMFQYINYEGKRVALRTDFTVPLARMYCAQKETDVKRYCYFGKVYRKEKRHKGRSSEFFQAGIELIGQAGFEGDLECLNIIQQTADYLKLKNIKIEISSAKFYHRLCDIVGDRAFVDILKRRDLSDLKRLIEHKDLPESLKKLILNLPRSFGDIRMLDKMIEEMEDEQLRDALIELKELYEHLDIKKNLSFDLAMTPSMKYYTGVMIKGYSPYSAETIINGGRYDKLMYHFDRNVPAIGFSYDLSHILRALEKEGEDND